MIRDNLRYMFLRGKKNNDKGWFFIILFNIWIEVKVNVIIMVVFF